MTHRPILFSAPMVRALLDGTKTQTRRVLKWQPGDMDRPLQMDDGSWHVTGPDGTHMSPLPVKFQPGDRLWVREAWRTKSPAYDDLPGSAMDADYDIVYEADIIAAGGSSIPGQVLLGRYRHARFMPRWARRLTLTVTDVRVQRLQDISEEDAIAEGITAAPVEIMGAIETAYHDGVGDTTVEWTPDPVDAYAALWDTINGPGAWDANPWVVALMFTVERAGDRK